MHLPALLCGFMCGWPWGLAVGLISPLLRSVIFGMPPMFPTAVSMAFEMAVYGAVSGLLYRLLPKKKGYIYVSLIAAMVAVPGIIVQIVLVPLLVMTMEKAKLMYNR